LRISSCWSQTATDKTNWTAKYSIICFMLDDAFRSQSKFYWENVFLAFHFISFSFIFFQVLNKQCK
jgi:hypothetical protein